MVYSDFVALVMVRCSPPMLTTNHLPFLSSCLVFVQYPFRGSSLLVFVNFSVYGLIFFVQMFLGF